MKINKDTVQLILIGVLVCAILYMIISNRCGACRLMNRREPLQTGSEGVHLAADWQLDADNPKYKFPNGTNIDYYWWGKKQDEAEASR